MDALGSGRIGIDVVGDESTLELDDAGFLVVFVLEVLGFAIMVVFRLGFGVNGFDLPGFNVMGPSVLAVAGILFGTEELRIGLGVVMESVGIGIDVVGVVFEVVGLDDVGFDLVGFDVSGFEALGFKDSVEFKLWFDVDGFDLSGINVVGFGDLLPDDGLVRVLQLLGEVGLNMHGNKLVGLSESDDVIEPRDRAGKLGFGVIVSAPDGLGLPGFNVLESNVIGCDNVLVDVVVGFMFGVGEVRVKVCGSGVLGFNESGAGLDTDRSLLSSCGRDAQ